MTRKHDNEAPAPVWPEGKTCGNDGHGVYDAYTVTPAACDRSNHCDPWQDLNDDPIYNSCTMVCMLKGAHKVAAKHGMKFGGSCFEPNTVDVDVFGDDIVCPGAKFTLASSYAGIEMFTYTCDGGKVIDYGKPYK